MIDNGSISGGGTTSHNYVANQLVARYTQSFTGRAFPAANNSNTVYDLTGNFTQQALVETGFTI